MSINVINAAGESVQLSNAPLAQGGEAVVYSVPKFPRVIIKLYHDQVLQSRGHALLTKIEAMSTDSTCAKFMQHKGLAWPRFSIYDERDHWRGYAMRKVSGVRMNLLAHAMAYREHFPNLDRKLIVGYLLNLLSTLKDLHAAGVMVGDYNLANFMCDATNSSITLIDCDSWQVHAAGKSFLCPVSAPDMLAPELLGKELDKSERTPESEYFSLAILIFKVLMLGRHPYDVVGGAGPVENIRKGYFPYGLGGGGIPKGSWFNIWSHLPFKLKEQFISTFKEGAQDPSKRTSISKWIELLRIYRRELDNGWHDAQIKPIHPKDKKYLGAQSISQPISA